MEFSDTVIGDYKYEPKRGGSKLDARHQKHIHFNRGHACQFRWWTQGGLCGD
jgi:hypothetical protein